MIIAQALYGGTTEVRSLALEISKNPNLPIKKVASTMGILQPMFTVFNDSNARIQNHAEIGFPMLSFAQMERLDDTLERLKVSSENIITIKENFFNTVIFVEVYG